MNCLSLSFAGLTTGIHLAPHARASGAMVVQLDEGIFVKLDTSSTVRPDHQGVLSTGVLREYPLKDRPAVTTICGTQKVGSGSTVVFASTKTPAKVRVLPGKNFLFGIEVGSDLCVTDSTSALVEMRPAEELSLFFEDGRVEVYRADGKGGLSKEQLTAADMACHRVQRVRWMSRRTGGTDWLEKLLLIELARVYEHTREEDGLRTVILRLVFDLVSPKQSEGEPFRKPFDFDRGVSTAFARALAGDVVGFHALNEMVGRKMGRFCPITRAAV